jgi:presenilin-like A22 family membrane protease
LIKIINRIFPFVFMSGFFILIDSLALLVIRPFEAAGISAFDNPDDPMNLAYLFITTLLFTTVILLISRFKKKQTLHGIFLGAIGISTFYILFSILDMIVSEKWSFGLSMTTTIILVVMLIKYPEWYVVDACGIMVGAGSIAMFGISLNINLVIMLLLIMAIYDAVSVYKTKHMIDLADTIFTLRVPAMLVIPKIRNYSLIRETKSLKEKLLKGEEREAFFIGLGDIIFPGILFVSTFNNIPKNGLTIALSVMAGTLLGFAALMTSVVKGKPQAGLPYLNSGAIFGYIASSYILFGKVVGL